MPAPMLEIPPSRRTRRTQPPKIKENVNMGAPIPPIQPIPPPPKVYAGRPSRLYGYKPRRLSRNSYRKKKTGPNGPA